MKGENMQRAELTAANAGLRRVYDVELIAKNRSHYYRILPGEELLPGVTGVLDIISKPALGPWYKKMALQQVRAALLKRAGRRVNLDEVFIENVIDEASKRPEKIRDEAADLGTRVHAYLDRFVNGERDFDIEPDCRPAFEQFLAWSKKYQIRFVMGDTKVASRFHGYGGSVDAIGANDDGFAVIDFKTTGRIYETAALQAGGAYAQAFTETFRMEDGSPVDLTWAAIARFDKLGRGMEFKFIKSLEVAKEGFLAAKKLKEIVNGELFQEAAV
jgi:hypothetical protein